jgi:uncharacterized OB-fold protein
MSETQSSVPDWSGGQKVFAGDQFLGLYQPSPETAGFWEGVKRRELLFKWCSECARAYHPRRIICPQCSSTKLTWKPASGKGKVYSFSEVHHAPTPEFQKGAPYTVGLVETAEGVHFFCRIVGENGARIEVDAPAALDFRTLENGYFLPVFVVGVGGLK